MPLSTDKKGVKLAVRLTPNASKNRFGGVEYMPDGAAHLKTYVTAIPEDGKANKALMKLLSKTLKIPGRDISVASGTTNRNKQILFDGNVDELTRKLEHWIEDLSP